MDKRADFLHEGEHRECCLAEDVFFEIVSVLLVPLKFLEDVVDAGFPFQVLDGIDQIFDEW